MVTTYYKIYSKSRQQYINGTPAYSSWSQDGRLFPTIGKVRTFITSSIKMNKRGRGHNFGDWQICEFTLALQDTKELHQVVTPKKMMELLKS